MASAVLTSKSICSNVAETTLTSSSLVVDPTYNTLLSQLNTRRMAVLRAQTENTTTGASVEQAQPLPVKNEDEATGGEPTSCPLAMTEASSCHVPATSTSATLPGTPISHGSLLSSIPTNTSTSTSVPQAVPADSTASSTSQAQDTTATMLSEPKDTTMRKELQDLLREVYIKYSGAQDDDQVERLALSLKASLLAGEEDRVRELKRELKVYLIAHHG